MPTLYRRGIIEYDKYGERAFAWIPQQDGTYGYTYAETKEGECGICGQKAPVLEMDNGEAGPRSACRECVADLFDKFLSGEAWKDIS